MSAVLWDSVRAWWPEAILSVGALAVLCLGVWTGRARPALAGAWVTLLASGAALYAAPVPPETAVFFGLIACDPFSLAFRWVALVATALVVLLVMGSDETDETIHGEYLGLMLLIAVGLMLMAEASHLLMVYLSMELVSLSSYALVGWQRSPRSAEAALKYLLFGALCSGIMVFGMSLVFGLTGELGFSAVAHSLLGIDGSKSAALAVAVALLLAGLAFKISMVPFHMWTPDVYEGAPIPVAALLSVGPKAAGLALLLRLAWALQPVWLSLEPLLLGLTIGTMTLGNLVALAQTNVKRLLAYSTIAQVGYLLIGLTVNTRLGLEAMLLYMVAYVFMNLGAFACVVAVVRDTGSESVEAFRGLSRRSPVLALLCALFFLSLAGIPPLLGFFGKFLLFGSAIQANQLGLAIAGAANSAVALYYYVNIIRLMYFVEPQRTEPLRPAFALRVALGICAMVTLLWGLFPGALQSAVEAISVAGLL